MVRWVTVRCRNVLFGVVRTERGRGVILCPFRFQISAQKCTTDMGTYSTESVKISPEQVNVYLAVKNFDGWLTANEISTKAEVDPRLARSHAKRLVVLGVFEQIEVSPGYRYRYSKPAESKGNPYLVRLELAREAFGFASDHR